MKGFPLPAITEDTRPFWDACRRRELVVQRCTACGAFRHPPSPVCWRCRRFEHEWVRSTGRGAVFSHAVVHRAFGADVAVPYVVALVTLDDAPGVRLVTNLVDVAPDDVRIGMPVEVVFDDVSADVTVPRFRARRA
jgi:uncharacterized OB-fold protein